VQLESRRKTVVRGSAPLMPHCLTVRGRHERRLARGFNSQEGKPIDGYTADSLHADSLVSLRTGRALHGFVPRTLVVPGEPDFRIYRHFVMEGGSTPGVLLSR